MAAAANAAALTDAKAKAKAALAGAPPTNDAAAALSAIAAAFAKDVGTSKQPGVAAANAKNVTAINQLAAQLHGLSNADQQRAIVDALGKLGASVELDADANANDGDGDGGADGATTKQNLGKVTKKDKTAGGSGSGSAADARADPTKLVSVPCFLCRPTEFKLLRDTMADRNVYAKTYAAYLDETYEFCHSMAAKQNVQVLRGTWDVRHYLAWCADRGLKPRAAARKAYFQALAELCVAGKMDEPRPSFEQYVDDTKDGGVLRYCCRLAAGDDTPRPALPVPDAPSPSAPPTVGAANVAAATATASDAKSGAAATAAAGKKAADKGCGKLESKPKEFALCAGCKCACYCSPECQKKDWKNHKKWCAKIE